MAENQDNSHKKTGAALLILFGVLALILGGLQIRNAIYGPFSLKNTLPANIKAQVIDENIDYQRQLDTDRDGLSNFDEMNVYETSAYLYDTFGYGMSDADVVRQGLALCPNAGKNCSGATAVTSGMNASSSLISSFEPNPGDLSSPIPDLQEILNNPQRLRQILIQSGKVTAQELSKIPDADLLKAAQVIFASTTVALPTTTNR